MVGVNQSKTSFRREFGPIAIEIDGDNFVICDDRGNSIKLYGGQIAMRLAQVMWEWQRDTKARLAEYDLDNAENARNIVEFWQRGTASNFEKKLIETYLAGDANMKNRLAFAFPAIAQAVDDYRRGR